MQTEPKQHVVLTDAELARVSALLDVLIEIERTPKPSRESDG